jgi:hypothetical protein
MEYRGKDKRCRIPGGGPGQGPELIIPNPKLKLMDQVREVLRVKQLIRLAPARLTPVGL